MKGIRLDRTLGLRRIGQAALFATLALFLMGGPSADCFAQTDTGPANVDFGAPVDAPPAVDQTEPARRIYRDRDNTFLGWMIRASGVFGFLILIVLFVMVALLMSLAMQLRRDNYLPGGFVEQFEERLRARDYQGAYEAARQSDSLIGRILSAGMNGFARDFDKTETAMREAETAMQEVGDDETLAMEQKIGYLALIASIAPMLGLLGTVQGMVGGFQYLDASNTSLNTSGLNDGIATALFTTLEGLVVCIPAIVFRMIYANRLARFMLECGHAATRLMKNFQVVGKSSVRSFGGAAPSGAPASIET
ncbi:MAG: MotA/TolQ/ExbB proton channel family protein [Planctomycetota bacterium]